LWFTLLPSQLSEGKTCFYHTFFLTSPTLGRWTSHDPLSYAAGDVNLYRTVGNNPLNSLDPSGLFWYPGKYLIQLRREYYRGLELDRQINERRARQGLPLLEPPPHWTSVAAAEIGDGLRIGLQANVNAAATATRSLVTLGLWAEPWEVWAVADEDRPYYESGFLAARVGWELLPSYGIGKLTQVPGQVGRWGRYALYWDTAQNAVQVGRGGYDIYENGLNWANGLQVGTGLLGLGGNYTTWRRLPGSGPVSQRGNAATRLPNQGSNAAARLPNLQGMDRADAHIAIRNLGFQYHGTTRGGYVRYRHPDGSEIWIRPNGEVMRLGPRPPGQPNRPRYDPSGNVGEHPQGEFLPPLLGHGN
jgi:hypothetical protein